MELGGPSGLKGPPGDGTIQAPASVLEEDKEHISPAKRKSDQTHARSHYWSSSHRFATTIALAEFYATTTLFSITTELFLLCPPKVVDIIQRSCHYHHWHAVKHLQDTLLARLIAFVHSWTGLIVQNQEVQGHTPGIIL